MRIFYSRTRTGGTRQVNSRDREKANALHEFSRGLILQSHWHRHHDGERHSGGFGGSHRQAMRQDGCQWRARRSRFVRLLCVCVLVSGCAAGTGQSATPDSAPGAGAADAFPQPPSALSNAWQWLEGHAAGILAVLAAGAAGGLAAGSQGPYPAPPVNTQCTTLGNQTNCTSQ
jgi:hypothetical protein